jgi:hypothetical protein
MNPAGASYDPTGALGRAAAADWRLAAEGCRLPTASTGSQHPRKNTARIERMRHQSVIAASNQRSIRLAKVSGINHRTRATTTRTNPSAVIGHDESLSVIRRRSNRKQPVHTTVDQSCYSPLEQCRQRRERFRENTVGTETFLIRAIER